MCPAESRDEEFVRWVEGVEIVSENEVEGSEESWLGEEAAEEGCRASDNDDGACCGDVVQIFCAGEEEGRDGESAGDDVAKAEGDLTSESLARGDKDDPCSLVLGKGTPVTMK